MTNETEIVKKLVGAAKGVLRHFSEQRASDAREIKVMEGLDEALTEAQAYLERQEGKCAEQPDESPYKAFFDAIWRAYCNNEIHFDDADFIITAACKNGLAKEEKYDPDVHGEALGYEWGLEKGDSCYVLAKPTKRGSVERQGKCGEGESTVAITALKRIFSGDYAHGVKLNESERYHFCIAIAEDAIRRIEPTTSHQEGGVS